MDSRLTPQLHQELHNVQMEVKQVQFIQASHAERLMRLERRQTEDAVKSVWNPSPFPSVLGGTPQHGPVQMPNNEVFDDFDDEQGQNLLGSLHLDADEEPTRRGAASRANSVRFDEATLHSSNWGQSARHSGEFGPARPGSGLGGPTLMERSFSHKSDGRHSSAGHSVHSFHSVASGRTSSLGLDLLLGSSRDDDDDDSSPIEITRPPPGLMFLGPVPSIVRCWLTTQYAHDTLQYAVVCTGSQKSTLDYSLLHELNLVNEAHRNINGVLHASLPVYFAEATVAQSSSRSSSPSRRQVPYINVDFEITGENAEAGDQKQGIRIFVGSDTLTANSADLLLSQNRMTLFGNGGDRDRLSVPFVRPEDEATYKHITTLNVVPDKPKLNASAPAFVSGDARPQMGAVVPDQAETSASQTDVGESEITSPFSSSTNQQAYSSKNTATSVPSDSGSERPQQRGTASGGVEGADESSGGKENNTAGSDAGGTARRDSTAGIWGSWRQGGASAGGAGGDAAAHRGENGLSGYQPAGRGGRNMKILKPQKSVSISSSSSAAATRNGTGAGGLVDQLAAAASRPSGEFSRRKSQGAAFDHHHQQNGTSSSAPAPVRWDNVRRSVSAAAPGSSSTVHVGGAPPPPTPTSAASVDKESKPKAPATRSNPVGGASAFSWMAGGGAGAGGAGGGGGKPMEKHKAPATPV
ncbi:hypothetical protein KVR01_004237 [Diaporthe batatas]|uniref:uncharacterized protein n=1 Tax=Diaporthe batatas TaxID=748121 RepID=UPI001D057579|nr:uncharacterized protein KVR01_004237 [Diaporthe batatas]KAG8165685.1 hypothetical protein KVR01_004237 [Diaporthe batatas]